MGDLRVKGPTRSPTPDALAAHNTSDTAHPDIREQLDSVESGSGLPSNVLTKTANFTAAAGDFILADATGGAFAITLPTGAAVGAAVLVKKVDASANAVGVTGTIDGDAGGASITAQNFGAIFEHVGSNSWKIVGVTASGADGADGTDGTDGADGADGNTILSGAGVPGGGTGVDGDFYIRTGATPSIYGPKTAGAWGSATSLTGAAGADGDDGVGVPAGGTTGQVLAKNSNTDFDTEWATASGGSTGKSPLYGTGADGDVTITGTVTLTRHMHYNNLIVNGTLETAGFLVYVRGTLTGAGTIKWTMGNAGAGVAGGYYSAGGIAGSGGTAAGTAGTGAAFATQLGGVGGTGGTGSGGAGGAGGAANPITAATSGVGLADVAYISPLQLLLGHGLSSSALAAYTGGTGGGGGGGDGTAGANGGQGGGVVIVPAYDASGFTGTIAANGGNGGSAGAGNRGGGAGGGGGFAALFSTVLPTGSYTMTATGGTGGTGFGTGTSGANGAAGTTIARVI